MKVNLALYNEAGLRELPRLLPHLEPTDVIMLVSGNVDKALDVGWLEGALTNLKDTAPHGVLLATAGLEHLARLTDAGLPAAGLVYIYEPNFPNVPEFAWEADATLRNLEQAAVLAGSRPLGFKPTGRPLYQRSLAEYKWDYGAFAGRADWLLVQTQTYCRSGTFEGAMQRLRLQCSSALSRTLAQVTLDLNARNGVEATAGFGCARAVASCGLAGVTVWSSPRYTDNTLRFLDLLRRRA